MYCHFLNCHFEYVLRHLYIFAILLNLFVIMGNFKHAYKKKELYSEYPST